MFWAVFHLTGIATLYSAEEIAASAAPACTALPSDLYNVHLPFRAGLSLQSAAFCAHLALQMDEYDRGESLASRFDNYLMFSSSTLSR